MRRRWWLRSARWWRIRPSRRTRRSCMRRTKRCRRRRRPWMRCTPSGRNSRRSELRILVRIADGKMNSNSTDKRIELRKALGGTRPPERIAQDAFERDEGHLGRMVRLEANARPTPDDLFDYLQDLRYTEIQTSLTSSCAGRFWRRSTSSADFSFAGAE